MTGWIREIRMAARTLRRSPAFTVTAVATLALGIGATAAVFTLLDAVVLRPLPYPAADRLVWIQHPVGGATPEADWGLSVAGYFDLREGIPGLEGLGVFTNSPVNLDGEGNALRASAAQVSHDLLGVLGTAPVAGRTFLPDDNRPDAPDVLMLGYALWEERYDLDPGVVGSMLRVGGVPHEIVGVLPEGFDLPHQKVDLWLPLTLDAAAPPVNSHYLEALALLAPGVNPETARTALADRVSGFPERFPGAYSPGFVRDYSFGVSATPALDRVLGDLARQLWVILGGVGVVLVLAWANVANLLLVRFQGRRREMAVRAALGAGRGALVRLCATEGVLLAAAGGIAGLLLAWFGVQGLLALAPPGIPRLGDVAPGGATLIAALATSALTALGLAALPLPVRDPSRMAGSVAAGGRGGAGDGPARLPQLLVVAQVAGAVVLLTCSSMLFRSVLNLRGEDPGIVPDGALVARIPLTPSAYPDYRAVQDFHGALVDAVRALPGVRGAAVGNGVPLDGAWGCTVVLVEGAGRGVDEPDPCVMFRVVGADYLDVLGIPVEEGRGFEAPDMDGSTGAVVLSRSAADLLFPGEGALGRGVGPWGVTDPWSRVVGVVGDTRDRGFEFPPEPVVYVPLTPPSSAGWQRLVNATLVVRTTGTDPLALTGDLRRVLSGLDPTVPLAGVRTLRSVVDDTTLRLRFTLLLLVVAAGAALLLGGVGIYGVVAQRVARRRGEIGVRLALGAKPEGVRRMVVLQSLQPAVGGLLLGIPTSLLAGGVLSGLLHGVAPGDPTSLVFVSTLLLGVAAVAAWIPARKAARTDPAEALRTG